MRNQFAMLVNKAIHYNQYIPNILVFIYKFKKVYQSLITAQIYHMKGNIYRYYQKDVQTLNCNLMYLKGSVFIISIDL